ncbi:MAG: YciI family protein [bacterium]
MQYLLLIYDDEAQVDRLTPADRQARGLAYGEFTATLIKGHNMKAGDALQPSSTATMVRVREGKTLTTDGPYAESREQLGGYYLIDAPDLDEAIKIAARIPSARSGAIEVRPIMQLPPDYPRPS